MPSPPLPSNGSPTGGSSSRSPVTTTRRRAAHAALEKAHAIAASRGVRLRERVVRARSRGEAIVAEAEAANADLIVMRAAPRDRKRLFGKTADYVLRHADCRVLVTAPPTG
jgi:basic amino acid/polyamine antiporter, APA family